MEILVAVAIIGILAAFLLGNIGSLRGKAQQAVALGNLRQVFQATQVYAADNNGQIIPHSSDTGINDDWRQRLVDLGYVQSPMNLASNNPVFGNPAQFKLHPESGYATFAINQRLGYRRPGWPKSKAPPGIEKFIQAESPSKTVFLADGSYAPGRFPLPDYVDAFWPPPKEGAGSAPGQLKPTFRDQVCLLFMDGHAAARKLGDIPKSYDTPETEVFWLGKRR